MAFDPITAALIIDKGVGIPPNDMQSFDALSQEEGIKLTFKGPKNSYLYGAANNDTLACTPAGVMVRYSDEAYPVDINDGELVGVYDADYDPMNPEEVTDTVVGLVFEQTYYFTAFPFSADGVYNRSQNPVNRATAQWVGNKGTINVTVAAYEGYEGEIGEYTITLVDQAESGGENITKTASGTGRTQIGNLEAGKTYVVTLTDVNGLTCDPSEPITITAGQSYNVTMTYREKYGTISVTVATASDFAALGSYTITLVDQASESPQNVEKQATGKTTTVFDNLVSGKQYKVRLGATENFIPPADSDVLTVVGGQDVPITMTYSPGLGSVVVNVSTNPTGMPIGSYTISLVPQSGGSTLQQSGSGSQAITFNNVPIGTYTVQGSAINHYTFSGGTVSVTGGQQSSHNVNYGFSATLEQATWSEINTLSQAGLADALWSVGDTKNITLTTNETLTMEIIGFNHDDLTTGGKAPITFGMKNLMEDTRGMNYQATNSGGYRNSKMKSWLDSTVYDGLPEDLKSVIKTVNKKTSAGSGSSTINTDAVKVFLFSEIETFGDNVYSMSGEGSLYTRFTSNSSRTKNMSNGSGSANNWWLRSPVVSPWANYSYSFGSVDNNGRSDYAQSQTGYGVCFGFCV